MTQAKAGDGAEGTTPRDDGRAGATPPAATPSPEQAGATTTASPPAAADKDEPAQGAGAGGAAAGGAAARGAAAKGGSEKTRSGTKERGDGSAKGTGGKQAVASARSTVATVVWVLAVLAALVLAAGALVVALDFNARNDVVRFLTDTADDINVLGTLKDFKPDRGPKAHDAMTKEVLVNWGICAVAYLVVGKVLDKLIRP